MIKIKDPIFLIEAYNRCYRCENTVNVVAIATENVAVWDDDYKDWDDFLKFEDDPAMLCHVEEIPSEILKEIKKLHPYIEKRYSKTAKRKYMMNTCPKCDTHFGDFFLHYIPGTPFSPIDEH